MQVSSEMQFNALLPKSATPEQRQIINDCLNSIDNLLKKECMFCGPILIDMIDNDIDFDYNSEFGASTKSVFSKQDRKVNEWDFN
jgi:hypothetical protein